MRTEPCYGFVMTSSIETLTMTFTNCTKNWMRNLELDCIKLWNGASVLSGTKGNVHENTWAHEKYAPMHLYHTLYTNITFDNENEIRFQMQENSRIGTNNRTTIQWNKFLCLVNMHFTFCSNKLLWPGHIETTHKIGRTEKWTANSERLCANKKWKKNRIYKLQFWWSEQWIERRERNATLYNVDR